jgi:hypothetical protein
LHVAVVKYSTAEEAVDAMNELAWSFGFNVISSVSAHIVVSSS